MLRKRNRERISLVIFNHEGKRVEGYLAWEPDLRLNPPIPLELIQHGLTEEITRVESTHIAIARTPNIGDLRMLGRHLFQVMVVLRFIDPFRWVPILVANKREAHLGTGKVSNTFFEFVGEGHFVKESPGVVMFTIE